MPRVYRRAAEGDGLASPIERQPADLCLRVPRRLELKQLAELGLMPEKEARPLLWSLMSAGFASLQEAPLVGQTDRVSMTSLCPLRARCSLVGATVGGPQPAGTAPRPRR